MKVGDNVEGTPEEITDFFENNGMDPNKYFTEPERPLNRVFFILPAAIILIIFGILSFMDTLTSNQTRFALLVGCASSLWLATNVQIRFKNFWATGLVVIGLLSLMLLAVGVLTPADLLDEARSIRDE